MIGKSVVEGAKKAIPMAGQKLSEFFTKEGLKQAGKQVAQQAGNIGRQAGEVGKTLYENRAGLASALGEDLTDIGRGIMKAPEAIKSGAKAVGNVASDATARVGKEAVRAGIRAGGKAGGQGVKNIGRMATSPYAIQTGVGIAAEQIAPRLMGRQAPNLGESVVRQATSQGIGMPVSAGLQLGGVNPTIAGFGGQLAGQLGQAGATQAAAGQALQGARQGFGGFLTGLGTQAAQAGQQDIATLQGIGGLQQQQRQKELDAQRAALLQAQQAPLAQYQALMPFVQLAPAGQSSIRTDFGEAPSALQAGLSAGLGAFGALGNFYGQPQR